MITIGCKSLAPLCKDYEFVLNDKNNLQNSLPSW